MYRIRQVTLGVQEDKAALPGKIQKLVGAEIGDWNIVRESVDARDKGKIRLVYTVDFTCAKKLDLDQAPDTEYQYVDSRGQPLGTPPVVAGFGPCGMFAALILADMGYRPLVLERGKPVEERVRDVERYWQTGQLNEESNVQFGEGGAGTFSDGKLTTGIKDPRTRKVLEELAAAGAGEDILYKQKPHIGTDVLREVVKNLRKRIIEKGGQIRFCSKVTDLRIQAGSIRGVVVNHGETIPAEHLILAPGHSARDTLYMLRDRDIAMEQKPFSMGVRIEHLQRMIDKAQYGDPELAKILGPADYQLHYHCKNGRGAYTFCMCPGGQVILAASRQGHTVTNGMSNRDRGGLYGNSGLLVDVRTSDFPSADVLAGVEFQETYEKLAFENGNPPVTTWGQFGEQNPVAASLPEFVTAAIREAMPNLGRKLKGFDSPDARMTAVESRSSSPVRILRDRAMESGVSGLYPAGEGAGYAGGIMSAAVDGIKAAEKIAEKISGAGAGTGWTR